MGSDISLAGKSIVVTGASRGIGEEIAVAASNAGAKVVLASRRQEGLDAVAERISSAGGEALAMACHVGKPQEVAELFSAATEAFGPIHGLVNNAATNPYFGPLLGIEEPAFDKTIEVNLKGPFAATQAFVGQPAPPGASVVNIASIAGIQAAPLQGVYGMTKAALISMTRTLAHELGPVGIRVNAIAPGLVETRLAAAIVDNDELREQVVSRTALGRHAQPDEIAGAAVYLLSDAASYVTGQTIVIDGGTTTS